MNGDGHFGLTAIGAYLQTDIPGSLRACLFRWAIALAWVGDDSASGRDCL
jgi:hypothetical protein